MFTYCKDFNQEINQARDQVLLDILLKICINYDSAEILVDTILDEFVSVFDKGIIDRYKSYVLYISNSWNSKP